MQYYVSKKTGSVYKLDNGLLMYAPLNTDNSVDTDFSAVEYAESPQVAREQAKARLALTDMQGIKV